MSVILIAGASHTGKTLLAQRLMEKLHIPYLSIDHLKMGLIRSGHTALTPEDDELLTAYLWPIVREIIKTAIENQQNLIVEGCYIPFAWRQDFAEPYASAIRFLCLAMTDRYIDAHFHKILSFGCAIEERLDDSDCTIERLKADNQAVIRGFETCGETVLRIDGDYEQTLRGIMEDFSL